MNTRVQLTCAWCGPLMTAIFFVGFVPFADFIPPPEPSADAETVAAFYDDNAVGVRVGMFLVLIVAGLFLPFGVAIAAQTRRIEARWAPIMTYLQIAVMAVCAVIGVFCSIMWEAAAFRPGDTTPEVTQALNDLGWFVFLWPWVPFSLWCIAIAVPVLQDRSADPVLPRWSAYLNLWIALLFVPAGLIVFTKSGPLAWDGVLAFYIPLFAFFVWVVAMAYAVIGAIRRQQPAVDDRDPALAR